MTKKHSKFHPNQLEKLYEIIRANISVFSLPFDPKSRTRSLRFIQNILNSVVSIMTSLKQNHYINIQMYNYAKVKHLRACLC